MSTAVSLSVADNLSEEQSGFSDSLEESDLPEAPLEEPFEEPNREIADQTQTPDSDGSSGQIVNLEDALTIVDIDPGNRVDVPPLGPVREHFRALQKWEGYVIDVGSEVFLARLTPIVGEGGDQEAEIFLEEVEEEDRELIEPGAVFYWSIGYLDTPSGRHRVSLIRFRRLPAPTRRELEQAEAEAAELKELFDAG